MENHEWCSRCGQSDFHLGETCEEAYPEQFRAFQKKQLAADSVRKSMADFLNYRFQEGVAERLTSMMVYAQDSIRDASDLWLLGRLEALRQMLLAEIMRLQPISVCTRPLPHLCKVNGPCNGCAEPLDNF